MARIDEQAVETIRRKEEILKSEFEIVVITLASMLSDYAREAQINEITDIGEIQFNVRDIIERSGYRDFIDKMLSDDYADVLDTSYDLYLARTKEELDIDPDFMIQLENKRTSEREIFEVLASNLSAKIVDNINNAVFSNIPEDTFNESIFTAVTSFTNDNNRKITDSMFTTFVIANMGLAIAAGFEKYLYTGPLDAKTRPFCQAHVGEIRTLNDWDMLDNGQINPVSIYRGGYNCRHSLVGVS